MQTTPEKLPRVSHVRLNTPVASMRMWLSSASSRCVLPRAGLPETKTNRAASNGNSFANADFFATMDAASFASFSAASRWESVIGLKESNVELGRMLPI